MDHGNTVSESSERKLIVVVCMINLIVQIVRNVSKHGSIGIIIWLCAIFVAREITNTSYLLMKEPAQTVEFANMVITVMERSTWIILGGWLILSCTIPDFMSKSVSIIGGVFARVSRMNTSTKSSKDVSHRYQQKTGHPITRNILQGL